MNRLLATTALLLSALVAGNGAVAAPMTLKDAIAKVERETGAKVLSAETKRAGRQIVYRIKILTHQGQVRVVEVPAGS